MAFDHKHFFHIVSQHVTRISDINRCFLFVSCQDPDFDVGAREAGDGMWHTILSETKFYGV